jgi:hypothetical protein
MIVGRKSIFYRGFYNNIFFLVWGNFKVHLSSYSLICVVVLSVIFLHYNKFINFEYFSLFSSFAIFLPQKIANTCEKNYYYLVQVTHVHINTCVFKVPTSAYVLLSVCCYDVSKTLKSFGEEVESDNKRCMAMDPNIRRVLLACPALFQLVARMTSSKDFGLFRRLLQAKSVVIVS